MRASSLLSFLSEANLTSLSKASLSEAREDYKELALILIFLNYLKKKKF